MKVELKNRILDLMAKLLKNFALKIKRALFLGMALDLLYIIYVKLKWFLFINKCCGAVADEPFVIVSLTSYPPRFKHLHLTLKSILLQKNINFEVVLWISYGDLHLLPRTVTELVQYGLKIEGCEDIRSYKKLVPLLGKPQKLPVVTADDDIYYWSSWLVGLHKAHCKERTSIVAYRHHKIRCGQNGLPSPYSEWEFDSKEKSLGISGFPTGIAGILYPPHCFHPDVIRQDLFMSLCPTGDDIWFYWMAKLNKTVSLAIKRGRPLHCWRDTQEVGLCQFNVEQGINDVQIKAMCDKYGFFN